MIPRSEKPIEVLCSCVASYQPQDKFRSMHGSQPIVLILTLSTMPRESAQNAITKPNTLPRKVKELGEIQLGSGFNLKQFNRFDPFKILKKV